MLQLISNDNLSKIAIAKNLVKEYKSNDLVRNVYLNDGTEFQIYIKNPYQYYVSVKIYLNDKFLGASLVLKPGESVWLERYLDSDNKFLFSTYSVENSAEMAYATQKNGNVKIEFFKEQEFNGYLTSTKLDWWSYDTVLNTPNVLDVKINSDCLVPKDCVSYSDANCISTNANFCSTTLGTAAKSFTSTVTNSANSKSVRSISTTNDTIETGRIEKGSKSDQKFNPILKNFENYSFRTEYIKILPSSRKPKTVEDVRRKYCSNCGKKVKPTDKFCSNCGSKLN